MPYHMQTFIRKRMLHPRNQLEIQNQLELQISHYRTFVTSLIQ